MRSAALKVNIFLDKKKGKERWIEKGWKRRNKEKWKQKQTLIMYMKRVKAKQAVNDWSDG